MLTQNSLFEEYGRDRVDALLREAEQVRLLRQCRRSRVSPLCRLLFYTGGWLVRCGGWLQRRYAAPTTMQPNLS